MPLMYSSHKEYIDISIPLFALEIWAGITRDYETMIEEKKKKKNKYAIRMEKLYKFLFRGNALYIICYLLNTLAITRA